MGRPFDRDGDRVKVRLDAEERRLLARLLDEVAELLDDGRPASTDPLAALVGFDLTLPEDAAPAGEPAAQDEEQDPALARLLPPAHHDDPELAAEFRRLTETGLRARKRGNLTLASAALQRGGQVVLSREEGSALLKGLTDTRLVLGERLGLRTDEDADLIQEVLRQRPQADDPWVSAALLYDVLTWWQEALIAALMS
ncbi:MAG TPA: DUF2017 domain-containing protein [Kineosporiaceae bacterium]|nr:DUF2017 domain-containing protein [Kineosporiaceae bacterium]